MRLSVFVHRLLGEMTRCSLEEADLGDSWVQEFPRTRKVFKKSCFSNELRQSEDYFSYPRR